MSLAQEITVCSSWWGFDLISGRKPTGGGWGGRREIRREERVREGGGRWGGKREGDEEEGGRQRGGRQGRREAALLFAHNCTLYLLGESLSLCPRFQLYCNIYMAWHTLSFKFKFIIDGAAQSTCRGQRTLWSQLSASTFTEVPRTKPRLSGCTVGRQGTLPSWVRPQSLQTKNQDITRAQEVLSGPCFSSPSLSQTMNTDWFCLLRKST